MAAMKALNGGDISSKCRCTASRHSEYYEVQFSHFSSAQFEIFGKFGKPWGRLLLRHLLRLEACFKMSMLGNARYFQVSSACGSYGTLNRSEIIQPALFAPRISFRRRHTSICARGTRLRTSVAKPDHVSFLAQEQRSRNGGTMEFDTTRSCPIAQLATRRWTIRCWQDSRTPLRRVHVALTFFEGRLHQATPFTAATRMLGPKPGVPARISAQGQTPQTMRDFRLMEARHR